MCPVKKTIKWVKRQPTEWVKDLYQLLIRLKVSSTYKALNKVNIRAINNPI